MALKHNYKKTSSIKLLGCSIKQSKQHLQKQFKTGMFWQNYGKNGWEIDHIVPCIKFDLSKISEQKKCFNYKNLQPLWSKENKKKKDNV